MKNKCWLLFLSISLLSATTVMADQTPVYDEESATLVIPSIHLDGIPGYYQQAELELLQDNQWQLRSVKEGKRNQDISRVELVITDSFPVQVFLEVSGTFTHGCARHGQVQHLLADNTFVVNAYYQNNVWTETPEIVLCTAIMQPFSFVYPLQVYGLPAGEYHYRVNDRFSGTFTLDKNNVYEFSSPAW